MLFNGDVGIAAVTDVVEYLYEKMEKNKPMIYTIGDYSQEEGVAEMNIWIQSIDAKLRMIKNCEQVEQTGQGLPEK